METFELRISALIGQLENSQPCRTQREAHHLLKTKWIDVCTAMGMPREYLRELSEWQLAPESEKYPAASGTLHLHGNDEPKIDAYFQADGGIVIQRMDGIDAMHILLSMPALSSMASHPH